MLGLPSDCDEQLFLTKKLRTQFLVQPYPCANGSSLTKRIARTIYDKQKATANGGFLLEVDLYFYCSKLRFINRHFLADL
jgi:hypothetical protein